MKRNLYNSVKASAVLSGLAVCVLLFTFLPVQADEQGFIDNFPGGVKVIGATAYDGTRITGEWLFYNSADELKNSLDEA